MSSPRLEPGFDPKDPFPLVAPGVASYAYAKLHAAQVDEWLGLEAAPIEQALAEREMKPGENHWVGLPLQSLLTPYLELRSMLDRLRPEPGQTIVDLGAGYGRMALVLALHHRGVRSLGYEAVPERVEAGRRLFRSLAEKIPALASTAEQHRLEVADLSAREFRPAVAGHYFLYDYGSPAAIRKTLEDLRTTARLQAITVIGRGRLARDLIEREHPWLSQVVRPEHHGNFSFYHTS